MKLQWFLVGAGCVLLGYAVYWAWDRVALYVVTREDIRNLMESDEWDG